MAMTEPTGAPRGTPPEPPSPGKGPGGARRLAPAAAPSRPQTFFLLLLILPGGLLIAAGIVVASLGAALVAAALRRLPAIHPASVPESELEQDAGDARPRVPWAACGEHGSSTGEPPVWPAPWSRDVH